MSELRTMLPQFLAVAHVRTFLAVPLDRDTTSLVGLTTRGLSSVHSRPLSWHSAAEPPVRGSLDEW